jgi:3-mercaptopyruvate sulfurtransferase SseA
MFVVGHPDVSILDGYRAGWTREVIAKKMASIPRCNPADKVRERIREMVPI